MLVVVIHAQGDRPLQELYLELCTLNPTYSSVKAFCARVTGKSTFSSLTTKSQTTRLEFQTWWKGYLITNGSKRGFEIKAYLWAMLWGIPSCRYLCVCPCSRWRQPGGSSERSPAALLSPALTFVYSSLCFVLSIMRPLPPAISISLPEKNNRDFTFCPLLNCVIILSEQNCFATAAKSDNLIKQIQSTHWKHVLLVFFQRHFGLEESIRDISYAVHMLLQKYFCDTNLLSAFPLYLYCNASQMSGFA